MKFLRYKSLTVPLFIALFSISYASFIFKLIKQREATILHQTFAASTKIWSKKIEDKLAGSLHTLKSLKSVYNALEIVDRHTFQTIAAVELSHEYDIQALEWIPRVKRAERANFERAAQKSGFLDFQFTMLSQYGTMVSVPEKSEYYPVYYVEPFTGNEKALGFDLASNPIRLSVLNASLKSGKSLATAPIQLVQEEASQKAFLLFTPVYKKGDLLTVESRESAIQGFVLGVFRYTDLVTSILESAEEKRYDCWFFDNTTTSELIYANNPSGKELFFSPTKEEQVILDTILKKYEGRYIQKESFTFAGRSYCMLFIADEELVHSHFTKQPLISFLIILFVGGTFIALLWFQSQKRGQVEKEVTARTKALMKTQEKLEESEARLQSTLSSMDDLVFVLNEEGFFQEYYQPKESRDLYLPPKLFIGKLYSTLLPPHVSELIESAFIEIKRSEKPSQFDYSLEVAESTEWFSAKASPRRRSDGAFGGLTIVVRNISDRKKVEEMQEKSEEHFLSILHSSPDAILLIDEDIIIDSNSVASSLLGYNRGELLDIEPAKISPLRQEDGRFSEEKSKEMIQVANETGSAHFIWTHIKATGEPIEIEVTLTLAPVTIGNKQVLQCLWRDLTQQKQAERALAEERKRLAAIIEGTNVGTWEWNVQTGEVIFNEHWASIIGYTLEELSPISIETWMKFAHPDDLAESESRIQSHFSKESSYYEFESRMKHKSGKWVWVLDRGKVNSWADDGAPLLMSGTHQEITQRKEAEAKIKEAEDQLRMTLADTEKANQLMTGREERIIDMKEEVNRLLVMLGQDEKYHIMPLEGADHE